MRLTLRLLGTEILDVELHPARPVAVAPPTPRPCRFEPAPKTERPTIEATAGGEFAFGFPRTPNVAHSQFGERPTIT